MKRAAPIAAPPYRQLEPLLRDQYLWTGAGMTGMPVGAPGRAATKLAIIVAERLVFTD